MTRGRVALPIVGLALALTTVSCGGSSSSTATSGSSPTSSSASATTGLRLVAIGDSIPNNSPEDCPGCTGFVDQYAEAVGAANGTTVTVLNESQHNSLTLEMLMDELDQFSADLASADVIVVGIAHNSNELASYTPCGTPTDADDLPVWSVMTPACARRSAARYRPTYDDLFGRIAALRDGKPTLLRALNRYNDWIGYPAGHFTPEVDRITATFVREWDQMICASAQAHGFGCADLSTAFNGPDGMRPAGDLLGPDYTHPSQKGNDLIAEVLEQMGVRLTA